MTAKKPGYLHGFSKKEQKRLYDQAKFLEGEVYENVDLRKSKNLIEVGCGVGAQTRLLLKHFPKMKITGVDASVAQIEAAQAFLKKDVKNKRVRLKHQNAEKMDFKKGEFDGAFLCWILEHVPKPAVILKEVHRVMKKKAVIYCSEVQNASLFVEPYSPALLRYWFLFNDEQWMMHGDPFVGAKLGNLLKESGFRKIEVKIKPLLLDSRDKKKRSKFLSYWTDLMLSGAPALLEAKRVSPELIKKLKKEITILKQSRDSVFFFTWIQGRAVK